MVAWSSSDDQHRTVAMSDETANPTPSAVTDSDFLHVLMETIPDRIYFKDLESHFVRNNFAHARWLGVESPDECIGKTDFDFFSPEHANRAFLEEQVIIRTGRPIIGKIDSITKRDGTQAWGSVTKMQWRDATGRVIGTFGLTRDVTGIKQAEDKLTEDRNLLRTIIDHLPSRIYVKDTASHYVLNNQAHLQALGVQFQSEATGRLTTDFFPGDRGLQALSDDQLVFAGNPIENQEKSDHGVEGQVHWSLTTKVPFHDAHGRIAGLVGISHDITQRKLAEQRIEQTNAEMKTDLGMARQIQEAFFPTAFPLFPKGAPVESSELLFAYRYLPAATLGGDFFDIIQLSDTQCGILICDVMGHGVRAGLLTALIRGVVEEFALRATHPAQVLEAISHGLLPIIRQTGRPVFATAFYGVINTSEASVVYANAGHPPPLIARGNSGIIDSLAFISPEPAAGIMENFAYTNAAMAINPGDTLLAYTDGFFEARSSSGEMFGEAGLRAVLRRNSSASATELVEDLTRAVIAFTGANEFDDDLCALVVKSTGTSSAVRPAQSDDI